MQKVSKYVSSDSKEGKMQLDCLLWWDLKRTVNYISWTDIFLAWKSLRKSFVCKKKLTFPNWYFGNFFCN